MSCFSVNHSIFGDSNKPITDYILTLGDRFNLISLHFQLNSWSLSYSTSWHLRAGGGQGSILETHQWSGWESWCLNSGGSLGATSGWGERGSLQLQLVMLGVLGRRCCWATITKQFKKKTLPWRRESTLIVLSFEAWQMEYCRSQWDC